MTSVRSHRDANWHANPVVQWGGILVCLVLLYVIFRDGLHHMVGYWGKAEYSHGYLIPFIVVYLVWQRGGELARQPRTGSWIGVAAIGAGVMIFLLGELSTIYTIVQYAFLLTLYGLVLALLGWRGFRLIAIPLLILVFMIPLPNFLYNNLSQQLQLLSSAIGVAIIRLFGVSVFLEGNVIDLGSYQLQVVEACSGLRYLFPLMTIGFVVAYFYQAALWKRAVVFLSTMPITILMNSFRIAVIGVLVENYGQSMAEGFLHDFEGWVIFMACFGILFIEMWILMRLSRDRRPLRAVFGLEAPPPRVPGAAATRDPAPVAFIVAVAVLAVALIPALALPSRTELVPPRTAFRDFPVAIGDWTGAPQTLEAVYLDALKLTDYTMANYAAADKPPINFYVAYYESQRKGQSVHSPRSCLPGGGWEIEDLTQRDLPGVVIDGRPLRVNRVLIGLGADRQLVYYWFQQRGRVITNEYLVKWFIFWDALTRNRTDGALVRLVTPVRPGMDPEQQDAALMEFIATISRELPAFVPG